METDLGDFQLRGAVIAGTERSVVWDTLSRPRDMDGVAELTSGLPLSVVYSHGDWDHVWGTAGLARPWDDILAHQSCTERFLVIPSHGQIGGPKLLRENAGHLRDLLGGREPGIREELSPFYRETHASNQAVVRRK